MQKQIKSFDDKSINVYVWDEVVRPIGVVQILHGMAEHAGKYEELAKGLNNLGYVVYADDHRGHGMTDQDTLGYCPGDMFNDTVKDEAFLARTLKEKYPSLKHILLAHSYGSFVAQKFISEYPTLTDGCILYGSNYKKDMETRFGALVARLGMIFKKPQTPSKMIERLSFGAYEAKFSDRLWLSSDPAYSERYYADPFCGFTCSFNFYHSFLSGLLSLYGNDYAENLNKDLPVLIISGQDDPVGDMGKGVTKLYEYYQKKGMKNVRLHLIPAARHVLLGEKKELRTEFVQAIVDFLAEVNKK